MRFRRPCGLRDSMAPVGLGLQEAIGPIESKRAQKVVSAVHLTGIGQAILASVGPSLLVDKAKE